MDIRKLFKPKDILKIERNKVIYSSMVDEVPGDGRLVISRPWRQQKPLRLRAGERLAMRSISRRGIVICSADVEEADYSVNVPYIRLRVIGDPLRIQRRGSYRAPVVLDGMIRKADSCLAEEEDGGKWHRVRIMDLSETGMQVQCENECGIGDRFICQIYLDKFGFDEMLPGMAAEVVRIVRPEKERDKWKLGLKFLHVSERMENKLHKFVIYSQRKDIV